MSKYAKRMKVLQEENERLTSRVRLLEQTRCLAPDDTLKLSILDASPFTVWACTRDFKIVLWSKRCETVYKFTAAEAIGKSFIDLFVDGPEKEEAKKDCLDIIERGVVCENFLAYDNTRQKQPCTMLTNCFRIWDERRNQYLQAEVGLQIENELVDARHKLGTIRELGAARIKEQEMLLVVSKGNLKMQVESAFEKLSNKLHLQEIQVRQFLKTVQNTIHDANQHSITEKLNAISERRTLIQNEKNYLIKDIDAAPSMEQVENLSITVNSFCIRAMAQATSEAANV